MWESDRRSFAREHGLTFRESLWYRCTAEHLVAKYEGGATSTKNIVAACRECNELRGRKCPPLSPEGFRRLRGRTVYSDASSSAIAEAFQTLPMSDLSLIRPL